MFLFRLASALAAVARGGRGISAALLDLLAPESCRACGETVAGASPLCARCLQAVGWIGDACLRCGTPVTPARPTETFPRCAACRRERWAFHRAVAAAEYAGPLRALVLAHKYGADRGARRFLVSAMRWAACRDDALLRAIRDGGNERWVVTSVPQHLLKRVARGRDPARELAESLARDLRLPYRSLLRKVRWTVAQSSLRRRDRKRRPRGSFAPRWRFRRLPRLSVLLVDDVLTTGTTASECARVLRAAGAEQVVVLAAGRS
ncbi:MAG: double zinc ribbon domain-containing protein [Planctomycetota bacterium]|nr:double zinc ribbon domain-containing protein [Planctomycetota bacterium]